MNRYFCTSTINNNNNVYCNCTAVDGGASRGTRVNYADDKNIRENHSFVAKTNWKCDLCNSQFPHDALPITHDTTFPMHKIRISEEN